MLLIADSGSTKTDWRVVDETGRLVHAVTTEGLNPFFVSAEKITTLVRAKVLPFSEKAEKVYFYGAGCGSPVKADQVRQALNAVFSSHTPAEVSGDILGAARSLLQNKAGIACILGTGANSCLYNGRDITGIMPSLGYMFSDWGSGTVMCKDLIARLLQENLPSHILEDFRATYNLERPAILDHIYNKPLPNRFLASFTPFLLKYAEVPECTEIIVSNFSKFFEYYVLRYPSDDSPISVSFTGSIAHRFKPYLSRVAEALGIRLESVVQHPMEGLVKYHCITVPVSN